MASADHYATLAPHYASAYFYADGPITQWQTGCILEALAPLERRHRLADVGGGDGRFAATLALIAGLEDGAVTLVEPSRSMIESGGELPVIGRKYCADALSWAASAEDGELYDRILLKEVVHHLGDSAARRAFFELIRRRKLTLGGKVIVATRPRRPQYPFFKAAFSVWEQSQPDETDIVADLRSVGFDPVITLTQAYPCSLSRQRWCQLVRARFWSTFSKFSDDELEAGCEEIRAAHPEDHLEFEERMVLVIAERPKRSPEAWPLETRIAADGFGGPTKVLEPSQAATLLKVLDDYGKPAEALTGNDRFKLHLLLPEFAALVRDPALVHHAQRILGSETILVWSSDLVCKSPASLGHFTPHQDSAYAGIAPPDACVTAWVALTDARLDNGCLHFWARSHLRGPLAHETAKRNSDDNNMLAFAQRIPEYLEDLNSSIPLPLTPGQCSWHTMPTVHWSPPNRSESRRVGFAIRYVSAQAERSSGTERESASLVAGDYHAAAGAFDLEPEPIECAGPRERAAHADAIGREARNYFHDASAGHQYT